MKTQAIEDYSDLLGFPEDLREWLAEPELAALAAEAARSEDGTPQPMLALITASYAAGMLCSSNIEWDAQRVGLVHRMLGRDDLMAHEVVRFRRCRRPLIEATLARLLVLAWQRTRGGGDSFLQLPFSLNPLLQPEAEAEAQRRVQLAVVMDLGLSE